MGKKEFWKPIIDDVQNEGCSDIERERLLDMFELLMREMADTRLRKGWYDLSDFRYAEEKGISGFNVMLERYPDAGFEQWIGVFESSGKKMRVFGTLSPDE